MEEPSDFQDWELLHGSDPIDNPKALEALDDDSEDGAIKSDYFALDSVNRNTRMAPSAEDSEEGGVDSDNPSWVDPDSESKYLDRPRGQMGFAGIGYPIKNSGGFWSDESSDGQRSMYDSEKGELANMRDSVMDSGFEGIEAWCENSGGEDLGFGGTEGSNEVEMGQEEEKELSSGKLVKMGDGSDSPAEVSTGKDRSDKVASGEGDRRERVWWNMPLEILKFCIFKVRPVWSISVAAAIVGFVMLGRRLYRMKHKARNIPLKLAIDDKKASQFMARAARLNEAFSVVRRVPIIRPSLPAGGVTPWPVVSLR